VTSPLAAAVVAAALRLVVVVGAAIPSAASARAAPALAPPAEVPPSAGPATVEVTVGVSVEITVVGSAADLSRVRTLVRPRAAGAATIRWRRLESFNPVEILYGTAEIDPRGQTTRCWIDLTDRRHAHLYFVGRSGTRFLIRDVDLSGKFDELDLTSLAEVIDLSLTVVVENDQAGLTRAEAEHLLEQKHLVPARGPGATVARPATTSSSQASSSAPSSLSSSLILRAAMRPAWTPGVNAGVFYAAQTFATALPLVSGPGLVVSLPIAAGASGWQLGAWVSGQYQIPASANADLASVRLATIATRAGLLALWPLGRHRPARLGIEVRLGVGVDTIHLTPQPGTQDASAALTPSRWSTNATLTSAAGIVAAFGEEGRVRLGVRAFADLLPIATHYDVAVAGQPTTTVIAPDRVRPGLIAEVTIVLGHDDH
jgi:hypothetical protein